MTRDEINKLPYIAQLYINDLQRKIEKIKENIPTELKNGRGLDFYEWLNKSKWKLHSNRCYINKNNKVVNEESISLMHMNDYEIF
jgi:hypothetical protein